MILDCTLTPNASFTGTVAVSKRNGGLKQRKTDFFINRQAAMDNLMLFAMVSLTVMQVVRSSNGVVRPTDQHSMLPVEASLL